MQIVGDSCADLYPGQLEGLPVTIVPLTFTLDGKTYRGGVDIDSAAFYPLIKSTTSFPTTSQPSVGDFAEVYERLAKRDSEILSVHISAALSGTYNSAVAAAQSVAGAKVTVLDTRVVSVSLGWLLEAAGRAARAGWDAPRTVRLLENIIPQTDLVFAVPTLRYLIHGGRISHLKGLLGRALGIKPLIGLDTATGKLSQAGQVRTTSAATAAMLAHMEKRCPPGSALRVQLMHGDNLEALEPLRDMVDKRYRCTWLPSEAVTPVLGAHTGPGVYGVVYAPLSAFDGVP